MRGRATASAARAQERKIMEYCIVILYKGENHSRIVFRGSLNECRELCQMADKQSIDLCDSISICSADGVIVERIKRNEVAIC